MHLVDCQLGLFMFQLLAGCVGEAGEHLAFNRKSKGTIVLALDSLSKIWSKTTLR